MAEAILLNKPLKVESKLDWDIAFNDPVFINNITYNVPSISTDEINIPDFKYSYLTKIKQATFSSCYGYIGKQAFKGCNELEYVDFYTESYSTSTPQYVGEEAFANCTSLKRFTTETVKHFSSRAFMNCTSLSSVRFSLASIHMSGSFSFINSIGDECFKNCYAITSTTFSNGGYIERIGNNAFENCSSLNTNPVGQNVCREIGDYAFKNCINLNIVSFNAQYASYCELGDYIFDGCTNLSLIFLSNISTVTSTTFGISSTLTQLNITNRSEILIDIESYAFSGYINLYNVIIPKVNSIGSHAFENCIHLEGTQPIGITECHYIGKEAFKNCTNLNQIVINSAGSNALSISGSHIFDNCNNTTLIVLSECTNIPIGLINDLPNLLTVQLINNNQGPININASIINNCPKLSNLAITGVGTVSENAFANFSNLEVATINGHTTSSITKVLGAYAFENCQSLKSIGIDNIDIIGSGAFRNCSRLQSISCPSAAKINEYAFENTCLENLILDRVSQVTDVNIGAFNGVSTSFTVYVPNSLYSSFMEDPNWTIVRETYNCEITT